MKVMLLHLSDIHIKTGEDPVLSRGGSIIDAVKNLEPEVEAVVCVLSGDVAYSGGEEQYSHALGFFDELKSKLTKVGGGGTPVHFVAVPGNHDCNFAEATGARNALMDSVRERNDRLQDRSFAEICLAPQRNFFAFTEALGLLKSEELKKVDNRLYAERRLSVGEESILFQCCNTAALSQLHEQPGSLAFPVGVISPAKRDVVTVGVLHHPYNWLQPESAHKLRQRLEAVADLVVTGHEHTLDRRQVIATQGENAFLEGGALQESGDPQRSEFYVILLDTQSKKQRVIGFSWKDERYRPLNSEDPQQYHLWEDFVQNRFRFHEQFQIQDSFAAYLDDPGVTLTHRTRGQLTLSDIFVYPDLRRINLVGEKMVKTVSGDDVTELTETNPCLFLIGDNVSGKTSLAKQLFKHLSTKGEVPVFIDAALTPLTSKRSEEQIEKAFLQNYASSALTAYRQLDRARRVIILDNYHQIKLPARAKLDLLHKLRQHSFRLIVFAHDLEITFQDLTEAGERGAAELPFSYYSILPFSLTRRSRLVERWLLLNENSDQDTTQFVKAIEHLTNTIDTLVGKNFVPAYPPYVLAVLQAAEAGTEVDLHASTHGYLYELFIKAAVAKGNSPLAYNVLCTSLSHIAYWMFTHTRSEIAEADMRHLHHNLQEKFEVLPQYEVLMCQLDETQMLVREHDSYLFRQPYIRYYFLAFYLRDHLSIPTVTSDVARLASQLYKEENANTLLFLSHLSKEKVILDNLLASAESQYQGVKCLNFDDDVKFLNKLDGVVGKLKIPDVSAKASRKHYLESLDVARSQEARFEIDMKAELEDETSVLGKLNAALKTIQILGQFLKNFPANLDRAEKDRIISACCSLARRALGNLLNLVERHETQILKEMLYLIGRRRPDIGSNQLRERAVATVVVLCELASAAMIARLSHALGSNELSATYDRLFPTFQEPVMRLVYASLQLDHYSHFPETLIRTEGHALRNNAFAFRILRQLVARYLAMFPTDYRLKQRLSQLLQLQFQKVRITRKEDQLIKR